MVWLERSNRHTSEKGKRKRAQERNYSGQLLRNSVSYSAYLTVFLSRNHQKDPSPSFINFISPFQTTRTKQPPPIKKKVPETQRVKNHWYKNKPTFQRRTSWYARWNRRTRYKRRSRRRTRRRRTRIGREKRTTTTTTMPQCFATPKQFATTAFALDVVTTTM